MNFGWVIPDKLAGSMGPVDVEDLNYLKQRGVGALVRMERQTISAETVGLADMAEYVTESGAPTDNQIDRIISFIHQRIQQGTGVAVSCRAGMGRAGTVLACYLVYTGYEAQEAINHLRRLRPGSVESLAQRRFVQDYEKRLKSASHGSTGSP